MDELAAMKLLVAGHNGIDDRNSDASADIPQQVVKTAGVADLFVFQKSHRGGGERNKHTPRSKAADDDCPQEGPLTDREIDLAEPEARNREQHKAKDDEPAIIDFRSQVANHRHGNDCSDSSRTDSPTGRQGRVSHQFLVEEWQQS